MTGTERLPAEAAEWAALCAAGALAEDELADLAVWREKGWPDFEAELAGYGPTLELLAAPAEAPPPHLRAKLLRDVAGAKAPPQELFIQRECPEAWRSTPFPGISLRVLHADVAANRVTTLVRMRPGALYPAHPHSSVEECLVLEGELRVGELLLKPGDYQRAEPGTHHDEQSTPTGALLLLTLPLDVLGSYGDPAGPAKQLTSSASP